MDRQTDGRTDRIAISISRVSVLTVSIKRSSSDRGSLYNDAVCVTWNKSGPATDRCGGERGKLGEGGEAVNVLRHGRLYNRCYYTDVHG